MEHYSGSDRTYGKRKRGGNPSQAASKLSRSLFFKKGPAAAPLLNTKTIDKAIGRALKSRNMLPPEQKFFEVSATAVNVSSTAVVSLLSGMVQSDTDNGRTGTKINVAKMEFVATLQLNQAVGGVGVDAGKVSLFIHKQANGAAPSGLSAAFGSTGYPYNNATSINYPLLKNALNDDQFHIIKDWDFNLSTGAAYSAAPVLFGSEIKIIRAEIPIRRVIEYNDGNAGTVADCIKNAFYLGYVSTNAVGTAPTIITWMCRIYYTDM